MPRRKGPWRPARGFRVYDQVKLLCAFDEDTFAEVIAAAAADDTSAAEQVRTLVQFGLESRAELARMKRDGG